MRQDLIARARDLGIEIGSHNHWHIVFPDRRTNARSLMRAERLLTSLGCRPRGFVAPAYFWHPTLYHLLEPLELSRLVAPLEIVHGREALEPLEGDRWRAVASATRWMSSKSIPMSCDSCNLFN